MKKLTNQNTGIFNVGRFYLGVDHGGESKAGVTAADPDTGWHDELVVRVKVTKTKVIEVAEVWLGVFDLWHFVVVFDDGVEHLFEHIVRLGVTGIDSATAVQILATWRYIIEWALM